MRAEAGIYRNGISRAYFAAGCFPQDATDDPEITIAPSTVGENANHYPSIYTNNHSICKHSANSDYHLCCNDAG